MKKNEKKKLTDSHPVPLPNVPRPGPDVLPAVSAAKNASAVSNSVDPLAHKDVAVWPAVDTVTLLSGVVLYAGGKGKAFLFFRVIRSVHSHARVDGVGVGEGGGGRGRGRDGEMERGA